MVQIVCLTTLVTIILWLKAANLPNGTNRLNKVHYYSRSPIISENIDNSLCTYNNPPLLLIIVISSFNHFATRQAIRETWAKESRDHKEVSLVFIVGQPLSLQTGEVIKEARKHKDVVINKIKDTYKNLTLKVLSGMEWMDE